MTDSELTAVLDPNSLAPDAADPPVAAIMRDEVDFCLPSTPIDAVAKLMADNTLSEIVVLLDRRPVGYVRQEDVLDRLVAGEVVITGSDFAMRPPTTDVLARDVLRPPSWRIRSIALWNRLWFKGIPAPPSPAAPLARIHRPTV